MIDTVPLRLVGNRCQIDATRCQLLPTAGQRRLNRCEGYADVSTSQRKIRCRYDVDKRSHTTSRWFK
jgi:hypothetical protein